MTRLQTARCTSEHPEACMCMSGRPGSFIPAVRHFRKKKHVLSEALRAQSPGSILTDFPEHEGSFPACWRRAPADGDGPTEKSGHGHKDAAISQQLMAAFNFNSYFKRPQQSSDPEQAGLKQ